MLLKQTQLGTSIAGFIQDNGFMNSELLRFAQFIPTEPISVYIIASLGPVDLYLHESSNRADRSVFCFSYKVS